MSAQINYLTVEDVKKCHEPVALYNFNFAKYLFVSPEKYSCTDQLVFAVSTREDTANRFILVSQSDRRFRLYNPDYAQWLFCDDNGDVRTHTLEQEDRNDFEFHQAGENGQYYVYNPHYNKYLYVTPEQKDGMNVVRVQSSSDDPRNRFCLKLTEDVVVANVEYGISNATVSGLPPTVLATNVLQNYSEAQEKTTFSMKETVSETSRFEHEAGVPLTDGSKFKAPLPFITAGSGVDIQPIVQHECTWGEQTTVPKEYSAGFTLVADPLCRSMVITNVSQSAASVPYKMTIKTKSGNTFDSVGIWEGVCHYGLDFEVIPLFLSKSDN